MAMADEASPNGDGLAMGATVVEGGVAFRVWAPKAREVEVVLDGGEGAVQALTPDDDGVHAGTFAGIGAGTRYRYRLDRGGAWPDPCSRFQPEGVHGPSEVVDPRSFAWTDDGWTGLSPEGLVIYEVHVGAYTSEGSFRALIGQLPAIASLGVSAIELMPVADFPGRWNWGYDGVDLYAPSRAYGRPDDLRALVDAAHAHGLGVILDVVYNHLGPDGNYLRLFSDDYFTDRHQTPWGDGINYDGPNSRRVRDFVIGSAEMWVREYRVDGFRLDATHAIVDDSPTHLLAELGQRVRAATDRRVVLIAEDERREVRLVRPVAEGGCGLDAVWADDFHHAVRVRLTGERESYYASYSGTPAEIARTIRDGFLYQGQVATHTGRPRGTKVTDEPASAFVFCTQNHDQVGNRAFGERLDHLVGRDLAAVAATVLLFAPETPLLWMGEEFAASAPFLYFTDHHDELGALVTEGRRKEFAAFAAFRGGVGQIPDPQDPETFRRSKLDLSEREAHAATLRLYRELIGLRRGDEVLRHADRHSLVSAGIGPDVLAVRRWRDGHARMLLANFGHDEATVPVGEVDVLRDIPAGEWGIAFSTADPRLGGDGGEVWIVPGAGGPRITLPARTAAILRVPA